MCRVFSRRSRVFLILVSSVLAPTLNQATPGSPPTHPSEVQVAAPRALPTPNQRQRYSVWTITPPPPAEARGPALPPLAPLPLHLNAISCIASHARHAAGPALSPHVFSPFSLVRLTVGPSEFFFQRQSIRVLAPLSVQSFFQAVQSFS